MCIIMTIRAEIQSFLAYDAALDLCLVHRLKNE